MSERYPEVDWTKQPLHVAAMSGNHIEVQRLLSNGANANEQVGWEGTPLHVAIEHCHDGTDCGHIEVARILLANGGDFRLQKLWAGTPLQCAARKGFKTFAQLLLSHGGEAARFSFGTRKG